MNNAMPDNWVCPRKHIDWQRADSWENDFLKLQQKKISRIQMSHFGQHSNYLIQRIDLFGPSDNTDEKICENNRKWIE